MTDKVGYRIGQKIYDRLSDSNHCADQISESSFVTGLWDTSDLPSADIRFESALGDTATSGVKPGLG